MKASRFALVSWRAFWDLRYRAIQEQIRQSGPESGPGIGHFQKPKQKPTSLGLGFGVRDLGFGVWGLGFGDYEIWGLVIAGLRFGVWGVGLHTLFSRKS